jgi:hypothetical protein
MINKIAPFDLLDSVHEFCHENDWTKEYLIRWHDDWRREKIVTNTIFVDYWELDNDYGELEYMWSPEFNPYKYQFIFKKRRFIPYGVYVSSPFRQVIYYPPFLDASVNVRKVIRIHERMHAYHHYNLTTGHWDAFSRTSPVYLEFLAQLYTYITVRGTQLEDEMIDMSLNQPYIYKTFLQYIHSRRYNHNELKEKACEYLSQLFKFGKIDDLPFLNSLAKNYPK